LEEFKKGVARIRYSKEMLELPPTEQTEWWEWLAERGLDDPSYSLQELHMRYQRFHKIKFGLIPPEE
jgi:hypothetical protein